MPMGVPHCHVDFIIQWNPFVTHDVLKIPTDNQRAARGRALSISDA